MLALQCNLFGTSVLILIELNYARCESNFPQQSGAAPGTTVDTSVALESQRPLLAGDDDGDGGELDSCAVAGNGGADIKAV